MEYSFPTADGITSSIAKPNVEANKFEIKPSIIKIIWSSVQFFGLPDEDPNKHLINFLEICDTFKFNGVSNDAVRLRIFPFSLFDNAKDWLQSLLAAAGVTIMKKLPSEAFNIIDEITTNFYSYGQERTDKRTTGVHSVDAILILFAQVVVLTHTVNNSLQMGATIWNGAPIGPCGMPSYAKFLKEVLSNKKEWDGGDTVKLNEECLAILQNKLPPKLKNPVSFAIPCIVGNNDFDKALCNLEDVLVKVSKFIIHVDLIVLDMEEDKNMLLILGRPFVATSRALIDVQKRSLMDTLGSSHSTPPLSIAHKSGAPTSVGTSTFALTVIKYSWKRVFHLMVTDQLDNDPNIYEEPMSDINLGKWLKTMRFEMDCMSSNKNFDPCIYKKVSESLVVVLVLYVGNILLIGNDTKMLGNTKAWLSTQFSMKNLGDASYILGIKIYRDRSRMILGMTQASYIEKFLKRLNENSKRGFLPMRHGVKLSKTQSPKTDEKNRKICDILYASTACAGEAHWTVVKTILKYLRRTQEMFLVYDGKQLVLEGYSDASFQSDVEDAMSQSGFIFKLNGGVVAWKSSKQDTTTYSTTEAEYIEASEATKEAVWMKNYIQDLGIVPSIVQPIVIFCDNNGATAQAKESRSYHKSKHILRHNHLLREMVGRGNVRVDRVTSTENTTNPLTKPVSQIAHTQHLDRMGLKQMGDISPNYHT
ncbi:Retrovirus-related Pol polyprotein from transposon TNT 1-94 [Sesamum angolense]|uniref:Retrovirus-related Pol polyprotein from transposon TNT 1-94 n=1 Tax=Sesamum angolense TaxID=2727404 RepID=A0AAE1WBZ4_9LAMI|nr:Retrovirus-related Pol polyprotein from transposon TNT 1-94 [Sesamum angolense]